ncbi:MAG TPA: HlyD family efflux transporter periplasmic adaptor subunit, partial [Chloroflexota bacterium]|nr:HlyD family efflux transporter periplasmic adaptor subunit [Chloroflexota bacterium]
MAWVSIGRWQAAHADVFTNRATVVIDTSRVEAGLPGTVKQVLVKPGDEVKLGQVVALLDDSNLQAAVTADKLALDEAQKEAQATSAAILPPAVMGALPKPAKPVLIQPLKPLPKARREMPAVAAADLAKKAHAASMLRQLDASKELAADHLKAAQADLTAANEEAQAAQAPLEGLQSNLDMAKAQVEKFQDLYNQGIISRVEFQNKQADADAAQAAVDQAKKQISDAQTAVQQRQAEVDASQANLQSLTKQWQDQQKIYQSIKVDDQAPSPIASPPPIPGPPSLKAVPIGPPMGLAPVRVAFPQALHDAAQAKVMAAQAALTKDMARLDGAKILAMASGQVVSVAVHTGQTVTSGETVVTLAQPKTTRVVAELSHHDALRVRRGETVTLTPVGAPRVRIPGVVYTFLQSGGAAAPA